MSVLKEVNAQVSRSLKKIFYFISDEYDIVSRLVDNSPEVFFQLMKGEIDEKYFSGKGTYKRLSNQYIEDCHYLLKASLFAGDGVARPEKYKRKEAARFFLCTDFHLLEEKEQGMLLKQFLDYEKKKRCILLLSAPVLSLPRGYEAMVDVIDVPGPDEEDIRNQLLSFAESDSQKRGESLDEGARERIRKAAENFKGLDYHEIEGILYELTGRYGSFYGRSAAQRHTAVSDDIVQIAKARSSRIDAARKARANKDATVTLLETGDNVAGLGKYKEWFDGRKKMIADKETARKKGCEPIRGVLMTGLPGTGKTQGAKYTAHVLGVPLVQLRIDNLLGGLVGDSEKNFKRYRKMVEMLAPCVVLIDEIEKLFSDTRGGNGGSSEVKMNIFAALLDWMQDNKKGIFFYATCNSVKNLPPELLRDGRFSMRFCVFMPTYQELVEIICYHMRRANDLSGGKVFGNTKDISSKAAEIFLKEITEYGEAKKRNMFFTGANIEELINNVQYGFKGATYRDAEDYAGKMMKCAKSEFCQPYGETNLKSSVEFWLGALENTFTDAAYKAGNAPLSFRHFNRKDGVFMEDDIKFEHDYDRYLYQVFSKEIERAYEKRNKDECYFLEQISRKLE